MKVDCLMAAFFLLMMGCFSNRAKEVPFNALTPQSFIEDSSTSFGRITDLKKTDHGYLFIEQYDNVLYHVDQNFKIIGSFGSEGKGPGEFVQLISGFMQNDSVYAFDMPQQKLSMFSLKERTLKSESQVKNFSVFDTRIAHDHQTFYYQTLHSESPDQTLVRWDRKTDSLVYFGDPFPSDDDREVFARSQKHILWDGNQVICVWASEPMIEIFDESGNLLEKYDLSNISYLQDRIKFSRNEMNKNPSNKHKTYKLINDVSLDGNLLYLLIIGMLPQGISSDIILQFMLHGNEVTLHKVFRLGSSGDNLYSTFDVSNHELVAFNLHEGKFQKFTIE